MGGLTNGCSWQANSSRPLPAQRARQVVLQLSLDVRRHREEIVNSNQRTSWLKLESDDDCLFAIRRGLLVAVANAVCTIVALVVYLAQVATPDWIAVLSALAHVVVVAALAVLALRKNRAASMALLVYLVSSWVVLWWLGIPGRWQFQVAAVLVAMVIALFNSLAVVATFRWHERSRSSSLAGGIARAA